MKKFIFSLILIIGSFMILNQNVNAEEYNVTLSGMQNNFNNNVVGWYTTFTRKGVFYTDTFSTTTTNSVQFYFDSFSNANPNVSYGLVSGLVYFNNGGNDIVKPYQLVAVRLNSGNDRYNSCTFSRYTDNIEIYQDLSTSTNVPMNDVYNFTCYMNTNINYNNIELVINQDYATSDNNYVQKSCRYGISTKLTIDYFFNDNSNVVSAINNNTQVQQDVKNNTKETNDLIKNDNVDGASSSANTWNSKNASNGVITQLLTLPITLLNAIVIGIQTSCSSFNLGNLFGTDIVFPCINLSNLIGSTLFTTIDLLISGFMIYNISKKLIKIFNDFTNLKSNQIDEIYGGGSN